MYLGACDILKMTIAGEGYLFVDSLRQVIDNEISGVKVAHKYTAVDKLPKHCPYSMNNERAHI